MGFEFSDCAAVFKALGDETRLKIFTKLAKGRCECPPGKCTCKVCACHILEEFDFTQPTLSYHIRQLTECGLIEARKNGRWVHYSVNRERAALLSDFLAGINEGCEA